MNQKRKDTNDRERSESIRKAVEAETKRIYNEAKEMFDEQLQRALKRAEKPKPTPAQNPSPKRRQNIKSERRFSYDNEVPVQLGDDMIMGEEVDGLLQSDGGDDSNDAQDDENMRDYTDIVDYVPGEEDEQEEDDDDGDIEYEAPKTRRRKSERKEPQITETSYTVLESGDIALTTELVEVGDYQENEGNSFHIQKNSPQSIFDLVLLCI